MVCPGDILASFDNEEEMKNAQNLPESAYAKGNELRANIAGKTAIKENEINIIPMKSVYMPFEGDYVIGAVVDINSPYWYFIDINSPYEAGLHIREASNQYLDTERYGMEHYFTYGEAIFSKIQKISDSMKIDLTMKENGLKKLSDGAMAKFNPSKFARVLGKNDSMINMIQEKTNTKISVGMNGLAWISGKAADIKMAKEAIEMIDQQGHEKGLTKKIEDILSKKR